MHWLWKKIKISGITRVVKQIPGGTLPRPIEKFLPNQKLLFLVFFPPFKVTYLYSY